MSTNTSARIKWNTSGEDIVKIYKADLTGKVVIVTGSNSGIGLETARVLSLTGAKIILPCRTLEKANGAIDYIKKTVPSADLVPMQLDLSDISSIKSFVQSFLDLNLPLHILINNAGVIVSEKVLTKDGFELQFGVSHLGHFLLTKLLTDKIKASAPSRIVIVSSCTNVLFLPKEGLDFDDLNWEKKEYSSIVAYSQSKLANIYHAKELQRQFDLEDVDVTVTSLHPGNVMLGSNLIRNTSLGIVWDVICNLKEFRKSVRELITPKYLGAGASTSVFCAISEDVIKGQFYSDNAIDTYNLHEQAKNKELAKRLWDLSERLLAEKM